jgi:hypothetical protein
MEMELREVQHWYQTVSTIQRKRMERERNG